MANKLTVVDVNEKLAHEADKLFMQFSRDMEEVVRKVDPSMHVVHMALVVVPITQELLPSQTTPTMVLDTMGKGSPAPLMYCAHALAASAEDRMQGEENVH